jgi:uncharacterized protein (DUF885 family)
MNRTLRWTLACGLALAPAAARSQAPARVAAATPAAPDSTAARVNALADEYMAAFLARNPETGTQYGIPGLRNDAVFDNSIAAQRTWEAREDAWLARIQAMDGNELAGRPEWVTYGFLRETLEASRQARVCRPELWPVSQMTGWQTLYPYLATIQPVGSDSARREVLARWRAIPRYLDTEVANLREGLRQGYSSPQLNVRRALAQIDGLLATPVKESPFYSPALRDSTPGFGAELERVVANEVNPAIRRYRDFVANEYVAKARTEPGVGANPNGKECYRATVRLFTTMNPTPEEIHRVGLEQMARIDAEMKQIAERSFHTGDVPALLQAFRTDPQYMFKNRQEIVDYARAAIGRAKAAVPRWFGMVPKADVVVEPYPAFQEASAPGGEYVNASDDGTRPGTYRINTYQPEKQSRVGLESTAFHETIPGHHLQGSIAQERKGAHPVTRFLYNSGYVEGWGLYAERLADEMGLFSSDLDRMGLLSNEALRAARMVVDPGIHALGWTRQQAIDYMLAHTAESRGSVETEVDRYIVLPGQATSYMTGRQEIMRLREQARAELGPRFDIREFHDQVLGDGSLTLPMLRQKIERWIAQKKAGQS